MLKKDLLYIFFGKFDYFFKKSIYFLENHISVQVLTIPLN
jgi:hypothetical protein